MTFASINKSIIHTDLLKSLYYWYCRPERNTTSWFFHTCESYFIKTILTGVWTLSICVKQHCDVDMSISLKVSQPWLSEINKICLTSGLNTSQSVYTCISLETSILSIDNLFWCMKKIATSYRKSKNLLKWYYYI